MLERRLRRDGLSIIGRRNRAFVVAVHYGPKPTASRTIARNKECLARILEMSNTRDAVPGQSRLKYDASTAQRTNRFVTQKCLGIVATDHRKATRLVAFGRKLREGFVEGQAD